LLRYQRLGYSNIGCPIPAGTSAARSRRVARASSSRHVRGRAVSGTGFLAAQLLLLVADGDLDRSTSIPCSGNRAAARGPGRVGVGVRDVGNAIDFLSVQAYVNRSVGRVAATSQPRQRDQLALLTRCANHFAETSFQKRRNVTKQLRTRNWKTSSETSIRP
jgi:hypothetical protein